MELIRIALIFIVLESTRAKPGIVDGGGYSLTNVAFGTDLVMQANGLKDNATLGQVTLELSDNSPSQKWGVAFYGSTTASLTSGENRLNTVTAYFPNGSSSSRDKQYNFISQDGNESFRIINKESNLCLATIQSDYIVDFVQCNSQHTLWIFQRNG